MISSLWNKLTLFVTVLYIKGRCRSLIREAGYLRARSSEGWHCHQCFGTLDDVQSERFIHTFTGETIRHPAMVATMCPRCAWVADGATKIPIWKWLTLKGKSKNGREFFLRNERAGLRMRLALIEEELKGKRTLILDDRFKRIVSNVVARSAIDDTE